MNKYLSLLRGINVSGQKKILMKDLKTLYEETGFKNVQTYIQSGNVIFETTASKNLITKIEHQIVKKYTFEVSVIIKTAVELEDIIRKNPFAKNKNIDPARIYITFLAEHPKAEFISQLNEINYEPEKFIIVEKTIYVYCPNGYGKTVFNNNFIENKLKTIATTRNWKTVNALWRMMKA